MPWIEEENRERRIFRRPAKKRGRQNLSERAHLKSFWTMIGQISSVQGPTLTLR